MNAKAKRLAVRTLHILGVTWCVLAGLFIFGNLIWIAYSEGFSRVQYIMSPFNIVNFIAMALTMAPGFGALQLSDWLEKRTP